MLSITEIQLEVYLQRALRRPLITAQALAAAMAVAAATVENSDRADPVQTEEK